MSILKRIGAIIKSEKKAAPTLTSNPFEETKVGDIISFDLEEYVVSGKVAYFDRGYAPHRYVYYLQNGKSISCLLVEKGRSYECFICVFIEGALNDINNVPSRLDIDGEESYELENHGTDITRTEGNTDFRNNDEILVWRYFATVDQHFFLQWQDGKFIAMKGMKTPASQINFMKSTRSK